jgi:hypothetical protein
MPGPENNSNKKQRLGWVGLACLLLFREGCFEAVLSKSIFWALKFLNLNIF